MYLSKKWNFNFILVIMKIDRTHLKLDFWIKYRSNQFQSRSVHFIINFAKITTHKYLITFLWFGLTLNCPFVELIVMNIIIKKEFVIHIQVTYMIFHTLSNILQPTSFFKSNFFLSKNFKIQIWAFQHPNFILMSYLDQFWRWRDMMCTNWKRHEIF